MGEKKKITIDLIKNVVADKYGVDHSCPGKVLNWGGV